MGEMEKENRDIILLVIGIVLVVVSIGIYNISLVNAMLSSNVSMIFIALILLFVGFILISFANSIKINKIFGAVLSFFIAFDSLLLMLSCSQMKETARAIKEGFEAAGIDTTGMDIIDINTVNFVESISLIIALVFLSWGIIFMILFFKNYKVKQAVEESEEGYCTLTKNNLIVRIEFDVGIKEKHKVEFYFNRCWGNIHFKVDGKIVQKHFLLFTFSKKPYILVVGEKEKHEIRVEIIKNVLYGAFRKMDYDVYIDENLFKRFKNIKL